MLGSASRSETPERPFTFRRPARRSAQDSSAPFQDGVTQPVDIPDPVSPTDSVLLSPCASSFELLASSRTSEGSFVTVKQSPCRQHKDMCSKLKLHHTACRLDTLATKWPRAAQLHWE